MRGRPAPLRAGPPPRPPPVTPRCLDAEAAAVIRVLANRGALPRLDLGRSLAFDLAAARAPLTPTGAHALDAVAGASARALNASDGPFERDARLLRCLAALGHATLPARELAAAVLRAAATALAADAAAGGRGVQLATLPEAAAAARAATALGVKPQGALMDGIGAALTLGVGAPLAASGTAAPPSVAVDWLCAAATAGHALPPSVAATIATARYTPVQAATAAACLALLGAPASPSLAATLRTRVAGARAGMPPDAAAAAASALGAWGGLDGAAAAGLLDAAAAGAGGPRPLPAGDWACVWAAVAPLAGELVAGGALTPRAQRGLASAREAGEAAADAAAAADAPPELASMARRLNHALVPPCVASGTLAWTAGGAALARASSNAPPVALGVLLAPHAAHVTAAEAAEGQQHQC